MSRTIPFFLQLSQRLGAVALLAMLGAWGMLFVDKDVSVILAVAAGAANVGLCSALLARAISQSTSTDHREANGVAVFNLVLLLLGVHLMMFTRVDVIRSAATQFFTPTVVNHEHLEQP